MSSKWKTISVFISSTFRDMHSERDILVKQVFPELREKLLPFRIRLVDIDLRWGITSEQAENNETIAFCLDSIDYCRPFFVGILGERYGWIPPEKPESLKKKYINIAEHKDLSITALEILHGVLSPLKSGNEQKVKSKIENLFEEINFSGVGQDNALFLFRDPTFADKMPQEIAHLVKSESELHKSKLNALKEQIRSYPLKIKPVENYPCDFAGMSIDMELLEDDAPEEIKAAIKNKNKSGFISHKEYHELPPQVKKWLAENATIKLGNLKQFEQEITNKLWSLFCNNFHELNHPPSAHEDLRQLEDDEQDRFKDTITEVFVGRKSFIEEVLNKINKPQKNNIIVLTGSSGSGKSSLLAKIIREWKEQDKTHQVFSHFAGASRYANHTDEFFSRLEAFIYPDKNKDETGMFHAVNEIYNGLKVYPDNEHLLVALDSPHLIFGNKGMDLRWLPEETNENMSVIFTIPDDDDLSDEYLDQLSRIGAEIIQIPLLREDERKEIIRELPAISAKTMDDRHVDLIADCPAANLPLFLSIALEELRRFGSFEQLEKRIQRFPKETGKEGLIEMYSQFIQRLEKDLDENIVKEILCLLACSLDGLAESDIKTLASGIPKENMAVLWRELRPHLHLKGELFSFHHNYFRTAIELYYLHDKNKKIAYQKKLIEYFTSIEDKSRSISELIYQYRATKDHEGLRNIIVQPEYFLAIRKNMPGELSVLLEEAGINDIIFEIYQVLPVCINHYNDLLIKDDGIDLEFWNPLTDPKNIKVYDDSNEQKQPSVLPEWQLDLLVEIIRYAQDSMLGSAAFPILYLKILSIFEKEYGPAHARTFEALEAVLPALIKTIAPDVAQVYVTRIFSNATLYLPKQHPVYLRILLFCQDFLNKQHDDPFKMQENMDEFLKASEDTSQNDYLKEEKKDVAYRNYQHDFIHSFVLIRHSQHLRKTGSIEEAYKYCKQAVDYSEKKLGITHELTLQALNNLAMMYIEHLDDMKKGDILLKQALERADTRIGKNTVTGLTLLNNLAVQHGNTGRYKEGLPYYKETVERKMKVMGMNNRSTLHSIYNLAHCYLHIGEYENAEKYCVQSMEGFMKGGEQFANDSIQIQGKLSYILKCKGEQDHAEAMLNDAFDRYYNLPEKIQHWLTLHNLNWEKIEMLSNEEDILSQCWTMINNLIPVKEAIPQIKNLVGYMEKLLLSNIERNRKEKNSTNTLKGIQELVKLYELSHGPDHFNTLYWKSDLGEEFMNNNQLGEAEKILKECVTKLEQLKGKSDPHTRIATTRLSKVLMESGRSDEAERLMIESLESSKNRKTDHNSIIERMIEERRQEHGDTHPLTLEAIEYAGDELIKQERIQDALPCFQEVYETSEKVLGIFAKVTMDRAKKYTNCLERLDQFEKAEPLLRRIAESYEREYGIQDINTVEITDDLGHILMKMEEFAEAITIIEKNLQGKFKLWGKGHLSVVHSLNLLNQLYIKTKNEDKYNKNLQLLYEAFDIVCSKEHLDRLIHEYVQIAQNEREKRIEKEVQIIMDQQQKGKLTYLGDNPAELRKLAEETTQNMVNPEHPEGSDEIGFLIDHLSQLSRTEKALKLWETTCTTFEEKLDETDPVIYMPRYYLSRWLFNGEIFHLVEQYLMYIWEKGNLKNYFAKKSLELLFDLIAYQYEPGSIVQNGEDMIKEMIANVSEDDPSVHFLMKKFARFLYEEKRYDKALEYYQILWDNLKGKLDLNHSFLTEIRIYLGECNVYDGNHKEGLEISNAVWNSLKEQGNNIPLFVQSACSMARIYEFMKKQKEATIYWKEAMQKANNIINMLHYSNADNATITDYEPIIYDISCAAEKSGQLTSFNDLLTILAGIQKRTNRLFKMNNTLWKKVYNLENINNQEEELKNIIWFWEETRQEEMIKKLEDLLRGSQ